MRVLLVANTLPPDDLSGVGEQVLQLAAGLRGAGHEVKVLGRGPGGLARIKLLFPLTILWPAAREIARFRPDVVQVHESDGALVALWVRIIRAFSEPGPYLVTLLQVSYLEEWRSVRTIRDGARVIGRPGWVELRFKWFKAPLQIVLGCLSADLADLILTPSRRTASEVERDYRVDDVEVLPNVMGGRDVPEETDSSSLEEGNFLLYVGRLRVRKAVEVLFAALARLERPARLLIAGDGEHLERLRRSAARMGVADSVRFLGRLTPGQVRGLMSRATALVVPSIYEGMPLVILEAMEAGVPVIASAVSGIPEVVEDGSSGWLMPPEDGEALAGVLGEALADPEDARRRGTAGRELVKGRFSSTRAAETWQKILVERGLALGENQPRGRTGRGPDTP